MLKRAIENFRELSLKEFFMLCLGRLLHRVDYSLLKTVDLEQATHNHYLAVAEIKALKSALAIKEGDERHPDYQLIMAQQSAMASFSDLDPTFPAIAESVKPFTMTSIERQYDLYKTVEYLVKAKVPGDLLECGVWRGGSMMLAAKVLVALGDTSRKLYLFDTYEGHPKPDKEHDVDLWG